MAASENKQLLPSSNAGQRSAGATGGGKWYQQYKILGLIFLVVALVVLSFQSNSPEDLADGSATTLKRSDAIGGDITAQDKIDNQDGEGSMPKVTYRPFCITYRGVSSARILQTSMGAPSQQWSHIPCYSQAPRTKAWLSTRKQPMVDIEPNEFGAPDAIGQMDLGKLAFPKRDTPILGFGAAVTEAAALNYQSLSDVGKETLIELLFGKSGVGYAIGRVHMNSCDFSVKSYNFDDIDGDFKLKKFDMDVTHDTTVGMTEIIQKAMETYEASWGTEEKTDNDKDTGGDQAEGKDGSDFKMFLSPWSPPSWMKAPTKTDALDALYAENMTGSAHPTCLRDGVGPDSKYAKSWALYFSKFISAYKNLGIPFWALTIQNEPEFAAPWEACAFTPETQADFLAHHLGPQLEKDHPEVKIFIFDHNKDHILNWANVIMDPNHPSSEYVSGSGYHWYVGGMDRLLDGSSGAPNMHAYQTLMDTFEVKSDHVLIGSEACHCPSTGYAGGNINIYWARAERYAHTIMSDLAAGSNSWLEWNLVLDSIGGPNHLGNMCDASILAVPHRAINGSHINTTLPFEHADHPFGPTVGDGQTREELNAMGFPAKYLDVGLVLQPMFFYMGHISRYVRPGSRAVMALMEESKGDFSVDGRTFRPPGQVVAGGGMNDLAHNGIDVTAWPCEGSTRQQFKWMEDGKIVVFGHDWLGVPTKSCLDRKLNVDYASIYLTGCEKGFGVYEMHPGVNDTMTFMLTNGNGEEMQCLALKALLNDGGSYGPRGGAQVAFGDCDAPEAQWIYDDLTGEIRSYAMEAGEVCLTTGWPFLQIGAYDTPNGESEKTVVILNEANEAANYILYDGKEAVLSASIPPRAIQTVLLD